jgi:hypothetical protein
MSSFARPASPPSAVLHLNKAVSGRASAVLALSAHLLSDYRQRHDRFYFTPLCQIFGAQDRR